MALNINGTTGISGVDGSASAPALQGTDSNTGINFASDTVNINTGGSTRVTVDSNGRLGIGVPSPSEKLEVIDSSFSPLFVKGSGNVGGIRFGNASVTNGYIYYDNGTNMNFNTAGTERMRLRTSTGGLMIGEQGGSRIGEPKLHVLNGGSGNNVASFFFNTTDDRAAVIVRHNRASGGTNSDMISLLNSSGNQVGRIICDGNGTGYLTSSDYRLKENQVSISDGITRLKTLKPYRFNFKDTPSITVDGFFAHEVTAVPEAISGIKDETENILYKDDDEIPNGKKVGDVKETVPKYQGIDQSKLVPLLTAALQEAIAKIEVLETKVAALEAT